MGDIGRVLNTARDAILANLTALNVTGSNVANVNTPGYSRLRPDFGSIGVFNTSSDQQQVGVKIISIERLYNKYLDAQVVQQEPNGAYSQAQLDVLNNVESIFNESTGGGINDLLSQFWSAWSQLSANPSGMTERDYLVSVSQSLASTFRQRANDLLKIQNDTNNQISDAVTQLNGYLDQMADLNDKIVQVEIAGGNAASMRDQRTELLRKIGQLVQVNYYEEANGALNVYISNGRSLVEGSNVWKLGVQTNPNNSNYYDVVFQDTPTVAINDKLQGGKLAGLIDARDAQVGGYLNDLDKMAAAIISNVNAQHSSGYDLNGNVGGNFFSLAGIYPPVAASGNTYAGTVTAGGSYTGTKHKTYEVQIVAPGALGVATYKVSSDGGNTWGSVQTMPANGNITLGEGINFTFTAGTFAANDTFSVNATYPAAIMQVDPGIVADVAKIAASATVNKDGDNAGLIAAIQNDSSLMGGGLTIDNYYESLVSKIGQNIADAKNNNDQQTAILNQMESQREAVSGVSLDEEMMNMIKYEAAYNAAGRLIGVINTMMGTLINLGIETSISS
ncbi:MAG TPA: flagellar hook-associated protein FlgK [Syntrophales bacterium]|nr:flagellar hook-associated protein FlgK [Syntrophales bacterium]